MKIYGTLSQIQASLKAPKGQFNSFGKYKYRSCEDIVEAIKPLLVKPKAALLLSDEVVMIGDRVYIKATATLQAESESVSVCGYAREPEIKKGMDVSQVTGACSSYARKYALNGLFAIDDAADPDTDEYATQTKEPRKKRVNKELVQKYTQGFIDAIASEDGMAMRELGDELRDTPEHDAVWKALTNKQQMIVKKILHETTKEAA